MDEQQEEGLPLTKLAAYAVGVIVAVLAAVSITRGCSQQSSSPEQAGRRATPSARTGRTASNVMAPADIDEAQRMARDAQNLARRQRQRVEREVRAAEEGTELPPSDEAAAAADEAEAARLRSRASDMARRYAPEEAAQAERMAENARDAAQRQREKIEREALQMQGAEVTPQPE